MLRNCCAHCPGSVTRTGDPIREHDCPGYVSGALRLSAHAQAKIDHHQRNCKRRAKSAKKSAAAAAAAKSNGEPDEQELEERAASCYERFATAKKFHAENLQHQPLPDRVDDAIFTVGKCAADEGGVCVCETVKRKEASRPHKYAPALGCKKPMTYMDLAICWETPIDETYEPRRAAHIDGSDGGPAPAIFTLVSHAESQTDVRDGCIPGQRHADEDCCSEEENGDDKEELCKNLDSIHITSSDQKPIGSAARSKRAHFNRHCAACNNGNSSHQRRIQPRARSASCLQKSGCTVIQRKNNGLPARPNVPRPRTPYARRGFCIDTLAPPFSIVSGCRDADYPEHWRLTSIYQQSYRNPRKMREGRTLLNYDRSYV